jgi:hypothetical protein
MSDMMTMVDYLSRSERNARITPLPPCCSNAPAGEVPPLHPAGYGLPSPVGSPAETDIGAKARWRTRPAAASAIPIADQDDGVEDVPRCALAGRCSEQTTSPALARPWRPASSHIAISTNAYLAATTAMGSTALSISAPACGR